MTRRLVGLLSVLVMVIAACGSGGDQSAGGPVEGIQVHGHWTIDVVNPDGSLDQHVEFENDLVDFADFYLVDLLAGTRTVGLWRIVLQGGQGAEDPCPAVETSGGGVYPTCEIAEAADPNLTYSADSYDLVVTDVGAALRLEGSVEIDPDNDGVDFEVTSVHTALFSCQPGISPSDCDTEVTSAQPLTSTVLSPPIGVEGGQTVEVSVEISFS